jgi:hypothetical protein
MRISKKAQVWYSDFMIGVLIFSVVIFAYFYYVGNTSSSEEDLQSALLAEAKMLSNSLISAGYPIGWSGVTVETVGLTDGSYRMNMTKLDTFNSWNYEERRGYLRTTKDYYFFMKYLNGTIFNELCTDSPADCEHWNTSYYLVQNDRLLIYNGSIVRMVLYVYQKP